MQFYALNERRKLVGAPSAHRHQQYLCPSCLQPLLLRGGKWRKLHFYHPHPRTPCHSSKKSFRHLFFQQLLYKQLESQNVAMEHSFKEIGRIADFVWFDKKIIFEIQCSPISSEEISARNRDYRSVGFTVVWLLYDKRFNGKRVKPAEYYLFSLPHYFINQRGVIYDQYSQLMGGKRIDKSPPFLIHLPHPYCGGPKGLYFQGDLTDINYKPSKTTSLWKQLLKGFDRWLDALLRS